MTNVACPSCGAPVAVRGAALPYVVCGHCQSLIRRHGDGLDRIGEVAVLPFDVSPIQLGTHGHWDGQRFDIVGRVRWGWADGAWNEWLMLLADQGQRWLGEAMGRFMVTAERPDLLGLPDIASFAAGGDIARGTRIAIAGLEFVAADVKTARCLGCEGDLPRPTPAGASLTSIDFHSPTGALLSVQRDADGTTVWAGHGTDLAGLTPRNLRPLDGWPLPAELAPA